MSGRIVAFIQGMESSGGIQRHSRTLCKVLNQYADQHGLDVDILSFTDPDGWYDPRFLRRPLQGCGGSRARFVARALAALSRPYDLLIVGQLDFGPIALLPHLLRPRAPIVALTYGIEVWQRAPLLKRLGLRIADRVVAISAYTAEQIATLQRIDPASVCVIPCTLDNEFRAEITRWQHSGQPSIGSRLLTIARMSRRDADKGIDQVIRALPAVRAAIPDVSYAIIGDGDDRPRLEQLAADLRVADIVRFAGRVPDAELHAYLSGADLFVMPSRKEGFGIVFLEAMSYGKPVIAGAHGGSPEVVIDGETGLLAQHGDLPALTEAITCLLHDRTRLARMGAAGLARVEQVYTERRFAAAFGQLFDTLRNASGSL